MFYKIYSKDIKLTTSSANTHSYLRFYTASGQVIAK